MSRTAIVTGAASGIGAAIAGRLSARGFHVVGVDLQCTGLDTEVLFDVTDGEGIRSALDSYPAPDVVITAAGHYQHQPVRRLGWDAWQRMIDVHVRGTANVCHAVLPRMIDAGRGVIVTIASELAISGGDRECHYAAANGAIIGFTKSLATEVASSGIHVNCVAPGPTDTPLLSVDPEKDRYGDSLPLGRLVRAEEIADTVEFLVRDDGYLIGQVLSPNGGAVI